jgi:hypothetical protein
LLVARLHVGEPVWAPLQRVCALSAGHPHLPRVDAHEFMYMGRLITSGRGAIHLYKHVDTRRYLSLDEMGHSYRVVKTEGCASKVRADTSLMDALARVLQRATPNQVCVDHAATACL